VRGCTFIKQKIVLIAFILLLSGCENPAIKKNNLLNYAAISQKNSSKTSKSNISDKDSKSKTNNGLNAIQKRRADQLISIFENGTIDIQYGYAEILGDGRGITCGRAGFTTGSEDAFEVVKRYTDTLPQNVLAKYLPELKRLLTATNKDDVSGLAGFSRAWSSLRNDPLFRSIQDQVSNELYYYPALVHANNLGLVYPLSRAELYDANIQHGDGDDADGLQSLINRTNKLVGGTPKQGIDEKKWLNKFLDVRENDLLHPVNQDTQAEWSQSTGRIEVFRDLVNSGNYQLNGPIRIHTKDYETTVP
jgi:chitosanase